MSDNKEDFEKFDKFKNEIENILKKIKETQAEIKASLNKDHKTLLLNNVENIQKNITEFKQKFINNIDSSLKSIIEKANTSVEDIKQLQKNLENIKDKKINN